MSQPAPTGKTSGGSILERDDFERHAEQSVHFFSRRVPSMLRQLLRALPRDAHVVDVGCGDGQLVWSLLETGCLPDGVSITGVDMSPVRVSRFTRLTGQPAILANGEDLVGVADASADLCISTMVMEHVPDDATYAGSLARIVRPGGWLYLTTVLRKPGAWYFRKAPDGRRVLDPTHVREYASVESVCNPLKSAGFEIQQFGLERLVFPLAHPVVRMLNSVRPIVDVQRLFLSRPWCWLEVLALPIPRYREIQLVLRRV